jgi:hypothetical protein
LPERRKIIEGNLTRRECEVVLKALGAYQIHLYDEMKCQMAEPPDAPESSAPIESNLVSSAIKKIHRDLEDLIKKETDAN